MLITGFNIDVLTASCDHTDSVTRLQNTQWVITILTQLAIAQNFLSFTKF